MNDIDTDTPDQKEYVPLYTLTDQSIFGIQYSLGRYRDTLTEDRAGGRKAKLGIISSHQIRCGSRWGRGWSGCIESVIAVG